jgi:hypothetical protein
MFRKVLTLVLMGAVLSSCIPASSPSKEETQPKTVENAVSIPVQQAAQASNPTQPAPAVATAPAVVTQTSIASPTEAATQPAIAQSAGTESTGNTSVQINQQAVGPDNFPAGVSPLTGLTVQKPDNLVLSPALVSITNFPVTARPQAGLSFSPFVFEMYIGEGMTRFLALFYGDYPTKGEDPKITLDDDRIGPVRSGRLPFESLRELYNGFLVMASASANVRANLSSYTNIFGSDTNDINSALISATKLEEIAGKNPDRVDQGSLTGLRFDPAAPQGGQTANKIWIPYNYLNQVLWKYDAASGAYLRFQDNADGKTFIEATDRLNKEPLTYENVVVLFAEHQAKAETLININLMYIDKMPALLFRDGKVYPIYWTTANDTYEKTTGKVRPIRFIDAQGNPFPLKPGQTWVEIVQPFTRYNETVDSEVYSALKSQNQPGSGVWAIHFYPTNPKK